MDLWQLHAWDANTALEETTSAIETALSSGRARYVGISNYRGWQTAAAASAFPVVSAEVEYSLLQRGIEREVVPAAQHFGIGVLAWGALGRGVLTGKYADGVPPERQKSRHFRRYVAPRLRSEKVPRVLDALRRAADRLGCAPAAIALAWVRDRPGVSSALVGARSTEQLRPSLAAATLTLPENVVVELNHVSDPHVDDPEALHRPIGDRRGRGAPEGRSPGSDAPPPRQPQPHSE